MIVSRFLLIVILVGFRSYDFSSVASLYYESTLGSESQEIVRLEALSCDGPDLELRILELVIMCWCFSY